MSLVMVISRCGTEPHALHILLSPAVFSFSSSSHRRINSRSGSHNDDLLILKLHLLFIFFVCLRSYLGWMPLASGSQFHTNLIAIRSWRGNNTISKQHITFIPSQFIPIFHACIKLNNFSIIRTER